MRPLLGFQKTLNGFSISEGLRKKMDLGSEISQQIKTSIKTKLQDLGSYVDDELPEYIMVMLSNRRGKKQMTEDLMLFLGENTVKFIDWLVNLVEKLKDVASLVEVDEEPEKAPVSQEVPPIIAPEKEPTPSKTDKEQISRKAASREKRKSPSKSTSKESSSSHSKSNKSGSSKSEKSKGSSSNRRSSSESKHSSRKRRLSESDDEVSTVITPISSVVKVQEKRPSLPPSKQATSSLLRKAVAAAHMSVTKVMHSLTYDPTSPPSPIKVQSLEEKQQQKELLLQQHRELQKQLQTNEIPVEEEPVNSDQPENGYYQNTEKDTLETEEKQQETTSKTEPELINEPVIELQVSEAEALELNAELVTKGDTRIVAFADSQTASTEPEEDKHKRKRKRAVKSRDRPKSPKFIVTLDGVDSELEDKFEKHKKTPKKPKSEFDDFVEIDTTNMPVAQPTESLPENTPPPSVEQVMFRLDNTSDDEEMHQMQVASRPPEKCKFWPDCMNGPNCPFFHPSMPCRTFPNCKFADKCLFIHPLCKFDGRCANTSCPYLHKNKLQAKPPALIKPPPQPPVPKVDEALPTLAQITPCKFYPGCTRTNCPFLHPKPTVTKVCRYGSSCSRADCIFTHPPNKSALKWVAPSLHISERSFALPEENVKKMPIAF